MFFLFHIFKSKLFWSSIAFLLAGLLVYGFYLNYEQDVRAGRVDATALLKQLGKENPIAHQRMQQLASQYGEHAVRLTSDFYKNEYKNSALDQLSRDLSTGSTGAERVVQLASLSLAGRGKLSEGSQNYLTLIAARQMASSNPAQKELLDGYAAQFIHDQHAALQEGGQTWLAVSEHPFSIEIYRSLRLKEETASPAAWDYYSERVSWMGDALLLLSLYEIHQTLEQGEQLLSTQAVFKEYIDLCKRYPSLASYTESLVKQWQSNLENKVHDSESSETIPDSEIVAHIPMLYAMYRDYGSAIEEIHRQTHAPASECVDIMLANGEHYLKAKQEGRESHFISDVVTLHRLDKEIWSLIGMEPYALLIYQQHREKARDVLAHYAPDGITTLLIAASRNEAGEIDPQALHQGVEAVSRYKEIALYILEKYGEDHRFSEILARDFRSVIYLAFHEKEGMNELASADWRGHLDKQFTPTGELKQGSWLENLPGGALVKMADNISKGYPSSWGEIGWAGVEVAEIGLVIASFGSSSVVTTAGKTAVKTGVRSSLKSTSTALHRAALRGSTRAEAVKNFTTALTLRGSSRFLSGKLARAVRGGTMATLRVGNMVFRGTGFVAGGLTRVWRAVPSAMRQRLFRVSAVALVSVELYYRTWPHRGEIMAGLSQSLARVVSDVVKGGISSLGENLGTAADRFLQALRSQGIYTVPILILLLLGLFLFFKQIAQPKFKKQTL